MKCFTLNNLVNHESLLRNFNIIFLSEHSASHKYVSKAWIANIYFFINYWIPFRFLKQKLNFIFNTFKFSFILLRQSHHKISDKIISGILFLIEDITNQRFLDINIHKIFSFHFKINNSVPYWVVSFITDVWSHSTLRSTKMK